MNPNAIIYTLDNYTVKYKFTIIMEKMDITFQHILWEKNDSAKPPY